MPETPPDYFDGGLRAWAGVAGAGLVLTLSLSALWASSAPERGRTPLVAQVEPEPSASPGASSPVIVSLYDGDGEGEGGGGGGAHDQPAGPNPSGDPHPAISLFDLR
ncbi:MAG: hypothetical protein AAGL98_08610 [Planctomycetota bacterium]